MNLTSTDPAINDFYERRTVFWKEVISEEERSTLNKYRASFADIIEQMQKDPPMDLLIDWQVEIVGYMDTMGTMHAKSEAEATATEDYIKEKYADEFEAIKTSMESTKARVLKAEVENSIEKRYRESKRLQSLLEERCQFYRAQLKSGDRLLDALQNKIIAIRKEQDRNALSSKNTT